LRPSRERAEEGELVPDQRALIHYRCSNPKHQQANSNKSDTLTIHEGKWAYCAFDIRAKEHQWTETGGVTVEQVRLAQRRPLQK
jgi:hypothetical protein